ncbi:S8 family serine peptidase [Pelagibius sp. Alg239-R121]|uniref:S8 family serine peptidase n=1 Tax=Pelagibius sp. Alg239-R121 TaxID=2993448 RepID=UPI0024A65FE1|nr:S8 family serine peptidase [Pelagibius sp. Alg239-R121]
MIEGNGLMAARGLSLQLELPSGRLPLDVATWQGSRLIANLGNSPELKSGHRYSLTLFDDRGRRTGQPASIELELCSSALADATTPTGQQGNTAVPGEVTLLLADRQEESQGTIAALGYRIAERVPLAALGQDIFRVSLPAGTTLDEAVRELRAALPDAVVDRNSLYDLQTGPRFYAKHVINWPADFLRCAGGGLESRIGLIDSGLDRTHPALAEQSIVLKSFLNGEKTSEGLEHATGIAALLVGRPGVGTPTGLLPAARLYIAEVFQRDAKGTTRASTLTISIALNWLAEEGLRVVNLSFAGPRNAVFSANLAQASRQGMVLIAAAGNFGSEAPPAFPAAEESVIAVTAVDSRHHLYVKASRGSYIDFAAPGVDIWTAKPGGGGAYRSGTSFAAPYVTAIVAAELSLNPRLSTGLLSESMRRNALDIGLAGKDDHFGWGLVRAPRGCSD